MSKFKPHIALLVCNILWAMDYPFYNIVLPEYVHPMAMVSGSLIATALLSLIPLAWEKSEKVARTDIRRLIGAALLIGVLRKVFIMYGLSMTSPIDGSIIDTIVPLLVLVVSVLLGMDRFTKLKVAGLALGIASLGWCLENALPLAGWGQTTGAVIGLVMIGFLVLRFTAHHDTLWADLKHPVVGSIVPTFAMCLMVVSKTAGHWMPEAGVVLWCAAVLLHLAALGIFVVNRLQEPRLELMVPSWFVPPIGIVVADVTFPEVAVLLPFAKILFWMGAAAYAVLLPLMIYRLFFLPEVPNGAKPTIAILAAPASLLLAGYLTVEKDPSLLLVALLFGIAILMTVVIYFAFWRLLRLQFSPGYAAFTFPMAIGATALYKLSNLVAGFPGALHYAHQIRFLAHVEVTVAAVVILYVAALYAKNLRGMLPKLPAAA